MGVRAAVPILTVAMVLGNLSRLWRSRREIEARVVAAFAAGAIPATALGAILYRGVGSD
jgi:hypothetical protein